MLRGGYGVYISPLPMRTLLAQFSLMPPFRATYSYNPNVAAQSPDGIVNYLLRTTPTVVAGVNSANVIDLNNPNAIGRGVAVIGMGEQQPSLKIHEWNLALEKQLNPSTVVRVRYSGKKGVNTDQSLNINPSQTDFIWYTTQLKSTPTGDFSSVARRPYDQNAYTDVRIFQRNGYLNSSMMAFEMERRFTQGLAFQAFYTVTNSFRLAGNSTRDDVGTVPSVFLPGTVPTDPDELNRFLYYDRDIAVPKHRLRWNWNYELPFGKGKTFGRNAPNWLNAAIGGWKFSGSGTVLSTYYAMPTTQWGEMGKFEVYGKKYKITDCRSTPATATTAADERCLPGYLYYNGYISERYINSYTAGGIRNGVFGLPDDYKAAQKPVTPWPKGGKTTDPGSADFDTNIVYIPLTSGAIQRVAKDTSLHPWRNQYMLGPFNWSTDASLMKFFNITERFRLRVNADLFNAFNTQGLVVPGTDGVASLATSYGGNGIRPRQLQLTMRLEW